MRRRRFIALLGGAAAWPLAALAQHHDSVVASAYWWTWPENDPVTRARVKAFVQGLGEFGWVEGKNIRIDYRWGAGDTERPSCTNAAELVALAPDVILVHGSTIMGSLRCSTQTRTVPIIFVLGRLIRSPARLCREPGAAGRQRDRVYGLDRLRR